MTRISKDEGLFEFFSLSGRLKLERRRGWVHKLRVKDAESVADHSYRVALMAMVYSDLRGLNVEKAVKIALLHDLSEAIAGDSMPGEFPPRAKLCRERSALGRLLKSLPSQLSFEYKRLWNEYVRGASLEAELVKQIDKLELILQAKEYAAKGHNRALVNEFVKSARRRITDPELLELARP